MILDAGIAAIMRRENGANKGDRPGAHTVEVYRSPYAERTVGMSRFYIAKQANDRVDMLVRLLKPDDPKTVIHADDMCVLSHDGMTYHITQVQHIRDEDAGQECIDLSLERIGEKFERP